MKYIHYIIDDLKGELSPEKKRILETWRSESGDNEALYHELKATWELTGKMPVDFSIEKWEAKKFLEQNIRRHPRTHFRWLQAAAAAAVILVLLAIGMRWYGPKSDHSTGEKQPLAYFSEDKIKDIQLPDGSKVRLEPNTTLRLKPGFNKTNRDIRLAGGAFFDVQKNAQLAFVVGVDGFEVKVLGTAFYVSDKDLYKRAKVSVVRGVVEVRTEKEKKKLQAGEAVIVSTKEQKLTKARFKSDFTQLPSTPIIFERTSILKVAAKIGQIYEVDIQVKGAPNRCTFTGRFDGESIEQVISILEKAVGLSSIKSKDGSYVWIVRKC